MGELARSPVEQKRSIPTPESHEEHEGHKGHEEHEEGGAGKNETTAIKRSLQTPCRSLGVLCVLRVLRDTSEPIMALSGGSSGISGAGRWAGGGRAAPASG